jgi:hypothetical protein
MAPNKRISSLFSSLLTAHLRFQVVPFVRGALVNLGADSILTFSFKVEMTQINTKSAQILDASDRAFCH